VIVITSVSQSNVACVAKSSCKADATHTHTLGIPRAKAIACDGPEEYAGHRSVPNKKDISTNHTEQLRHLAAPRCRRAQCDRTSVAYALTIHLASPGCVASVRRRLLKAHNSVNSQRSTIGRWISFSDESGSRSHALIPRQTLPGPPSTTLYSLSTPCPDFSARHPFDSRISTDYLDLMLARQQHVTLIGIRNIRQKDHRVACAVPLDDFSRSPESRVHDQGVGIWQHLTFLCTLPSVVALYAS